jgi:hypothetical protein
MRTDAFVEHLDDESYWQMNQIKDARNGGRRAAKIRLRSIVPVMTTLIACDLLGR